MYSCKKAVSDSQIVRNHQIIMIMYGEQGTVINFALILSANDDGTTK